jgi:DNA-binding transcriptional MerR regulator/effector-binding domain-containing protein
MFKIGDFSKLSRVSVKTLRYYDELGLLKPARIDRFTGYRFYSADQLPRLNRILALKDLGFALDEIAGVLDEQDSVEQVRALLRQKHAELQQRVQDEQARLARVEARLRVIEQEDTMSTYEVMLKQTEPQLTVSARGVITSPEHRLVYRDGAMFAEGDLVDVIGEHCRVLSAEVCELLPRTVLRESGPWILIYNQTEEAIDLEMALVVEGTPSAMNNDRIGVRLLRGEDQAACVVHHGSYDTLQQAYTALGRWLEANGYQIAGACREVYLQGPDDPTTEVQIPVEKM